MISHQKQKNYMRTFYEVGEGLFTVERVAGFNFVYDCGGQRFDDNNGGKGIRTIVKETFSEGEEIEAVFISHYDNDHINGIHTLLTHCKVKRLILPMMSDLQRCWYIVTQIYNSDLLAFVLSPDDYVQNLGIETKINYVYYPNEEELHPNDIPDAFEDLGNGQLDNIPSGCKLRVKSGVDWVFIPYNIRILAKTEEDNFLDELRKIYPTLGYNKNKIKDLWEANSLATGKSNKVKTALKNAILRATGKNLTDINATSLTVYSGPLCPTSAIQYRCGCLYLGDYNAKDNFKNLMTAYSVVWNNVGIVQIPHHGSDHNFDKGLVNQGMLCVVSCPIPCYKVKPCNVIKDIIANGGIELVTGLKGDITL